MPRYRFAPEKSRFTVQAYSTGALSILGHNPTFAVGDYHGTVHLDGPGAEGLALELVARADSLDLVDRVKPSDREQILGQMRREVLESSTFPEITFRTVEVAADPVGGDRYRMFLGGRLTLHGVTNPHGSDAELLVRPDGPRLTGVCVLSMSAYRIRPVSALCGTIRLKNELKVSFDLVAVVEGP
jgi:polyisoprenoid-binding protein YceI